MNPTGPPYDKAADGLVGMERESCSEAYRNTHSMASESRHLIYGKMTAVWWERILRKGSFYKTDFFGSIEDRSFYTCEAESQACEG